MFLVLAYSLGILGLYRTIVKVPCLFLLFPRLACMPRPGTFVGLLLGCDELSPNPLFRTVSMIVALPSRTPLAPVAYGRDIVCSSLCPMSVSLFRPIRSPFPVEMIVDMGVRLG